MAVKVFSTRQLHMIKGVSFLLERGSAFFAKKEKKNRKLNRERELESQKKKRKKRKRKELKKIAKGKFDTNSIVILFSFRYE